MMTVLLESGGARGPRRATWTIGSVSVHVLVIGAGVALGTQAPAVVDVAPVPVIPVIYDAPRPDQRTTPAHASPALSGAPLPPTIPIDVPSVPAFDVTRAFAPSPIPVTELFRRHGGPVEAAAAVESGGVHAGGSVDRIAAPLPDNGAPDYPRALRTAGVEGSVVVTFVVDTSGRTEPGSITIVSTTHDLFADAVRRWLTRTRYTPAEIRGQRVRQLVQQEVGFTLTR